MITKEDQAQINKMKPKFILKALFPIIGLVLCANLFAQQVNTLFSHSHIAEGLYVAGDGKVFTACGGSVDKNSIGMYDPVKKEFVLVSNEMRGSIDIISNDDQTLFVTNYDDNSVKSFNVKTGKTTTLASGFDGPAGIEIDKGGNLYLTNYGAPPAYAGNSVWRITPEGEKQLVIQSDELYRPQGIGWFDQKTLVISNSANGKLFLLDIEKKELKPLVTTGKKHGHLTIGKGQIFVASPGSHRILVLNRKGELISTYGGEKPGTMDGPLGTASFVSPLGLAINPEETILYISQIHNNTLRSIDFSK